MQILKLFNQVFDILIQNQFHLIHLESNYTKFSHCWKALTRCAMLCNAATFKDDPINLSKPILLRQCDGDASETAILKCMEAAVCY
jgi:hypothetical protein